VTQIDITEFFDGVKTEVSRLYQCPLKLFLLCKVEVETDFSYFFPFTPCLLLKALGPLDFLTLGFVGLSGFFWSIQKALI